MRLLGSYVLHVYLVKKVLYISTYVVTVLTFSSVVKLWFGLTHDCW